MENFVTNEIPYDTRCESNIYTFGTLVTFTYTNHRNETAVRKVVPLHLVYGRHCDYCPGDTNTESEWLLVCFDTERNAVRHFALSKIEPR